MAIENFARALEIIRVKKYNGKKPAFDSWLMDITERHIMTLESRL